MLAALHDPVLVLASLAVVFGLVLAARAGGARGIPPLVIRRSLHVVVGLWTLWITPQFRSLGWALIPPLFFFGVNASGRTAAWTAAAAGAGDARSRRGLWAFPLGIAIAYALFWQAPGRAPILAGCAVLALADPAAAIVGARWGQRRFYPTRYGKTLEGSIAFFLVAAAVIGWIVAWKTPGALPLRVSVGAGAIGAVTEAASPPGWDNLLVPLTVAAAYYWFA